MRSGSQNDDELDIKSAIDSVLPVTKLQIC